jgi:hypothetical protein
MAALRQLMASNYIELLRERVFTYTNADRKDSLKFQRLLSSEESSQVLDIVWKESEFVVKYELLESGYTDKAFTKPMTCHALGIMLADDKNEVAATVTRVRNIVLAGSAFGLIQRYQKHAKSVPFSGTESLHDFMIELGVRNIRQCRRFIPQQGISSHHIPDTQADPIERQL